MGAFGFFAYFIFAFAVLSGLAVFGYDRFLAAKFASTSAALRQAETSLNPETVRDFVRLRDRLVSGKSLLDAHTQFSNIFAALEEVLPKDVRFTTMRVATDQQGRPLFTAAGSARTFNALAAASDALARDRRIKSAIFSDIAVLADGSVSFAVAASVEPALVKFVVSSKPSPSVSESPDTEESSEPIP